MRKCVSVLVVLLASVVLAGCPGKNCTTCGSLMAPSPTTPTTPGVYTSHKSFTTADVDVQVTCGGGVVVTVKVHGEASADGTGSTQAEADADALKRATDAANINLQVNLKVDVNVVCVANNASPPTTPPGTFSSTQSATESATATCPSGSTGNSVTKTVTANGTGTSSTSQADADAKALVQAHANALAQAQAQAQAALVCVVTPPTVTLTANPTSGSSPLTTTLSWVTGNNPTSCTASNGWSGQKAAGGSQEVISGLTSTTTFTLACTNAGGTSSSSVTVTVSTTPPPCTYQVEANLNIGYAGGPGSFSISTQSGCAWSVTKTGNNAWFGLKASSLPGADLAIVSGTGNGTAWLYVLLNQDPATRIGTLTLTKQDGTSISLTVTQGHQ